MQRSLVGSEMCIRDSSWMSKCTTMVCLSTAEAEFIAATEAAKDVIWIRGLLSELSLDSASPTVIFEDNQACVSMINNHAMSPRNHHFAVKMAWLREQFSANKIKFFFVQSKKTLADLFTKVLPEDQFRALRDQLMKGVCIAGGVLDHINVTLTHPISLTVSTHIYITLIHFHYSCSSSNLGLDTQDTSTTL